MEVSIEVAKNAAKAIHSEVRVSFDSSVELNRHFRVLIIDDKEVTIG